MTERISDDVQNYQHLVAALKAENESLKEKIRVLERKCACSRNNQKLCEANDETS